MSVQTKLQYLKPLKMWDDIKPYQIIGRRSPGQPRENIELQAYTSTILDVKSLDHTPSLDNEGFQWIYNELTDDLADEAGTKNHLQAMENFLKGFFGAKGVVTYDYQTRKRETGRSTPQIRPVSNTVHIDITPEGALERILFSFPKQAPEILKNRFRLLRLVCTVPNAFKQDPNDISIWRPLFGPIRDYPLAVCDSRTVSEDDLVESDYIYPNFEGENFMVKANAAHRWYYMRDQGQNDALIITNYDSESGCRVPHSGFELPPDETVTRLRESFEMRVVVYYD